MKKIWELKQAAEPNVLDMYIYGDVKGDGYDWWTDEKITSETSASHFREELAKYPNVMQINVYINSYGGSVFEGTAIYSQLKRHTAQKTVYVDGFACSVASVIAMAGDKIIMPRNTMMMIHNALNCVCGNSKELRKAADDLDTIMDGNRQAYLQKSNGKISEEKLIELLENETWLTAQQCLDYGFCDEILGQDKDLTEAQQMLQKMNKTLEQHLNYNKAITAQLKELVEIIEPTQIKEIPLEVSPVEESIKDEEPIVQNKENKPKQLLSALFREKERGNN
ncbi:MAG: Clp protease family protein [Clostridiales bacterium]|nr:Clp protease family protein [Clostridiales bacterium]